YTAPPIKPVSTIGAGDNFNAGIVYGIIKNNIDRNDIRSNIKKEILDDIVEHATSFAQEVCMSQENYIAATHNAQFVMPSLASSGRRM
ncbi:MAG: hypothetical protein IIT37_13670, partial [Bacteroidales bacterium]|nr:hypothetical protein [Bacteroidales bacterium]